MTSEITTSRSTSLTDLDTLADMINTESAAVEAYLHRGFEHAVRAGLLLIEAKKQVPHGQWLSWLEENCTVAERTAQIYMRVAKHRPKLGTESATVADLTLRGAVAAIAGPKDVPEIDAIDSHRIPQDGHCLIGLLPGHRGYVVIHPSQHEGFYWIGICETLEPDDPNSGGLATCMKRPMLPAGFGLFLRYALPAAAIDNIEWGEQPFTHRNNQFLFGVVARTATAT